MAALNLIIYVLHEHQTSIIFLEFSVTTRRWISVSKEMWGIAV